MSHVIFNIFKSSYLKGLIKNEKRNINIIIIKHLIGPDDYPVDYSWYENTKHASLREADTGNYNYQD